MPCSVYVELICGIYNKIANMIEIISLADDINFKDCVCIRSNAVLIELILYQIGPAWDKPLKVDIIWMKIMLIVANALSR